MDGPQNHSPPDVCVNRCLITFSHASDVCPFKMLSKAPLPILLVFLTFLLVLAYPRVLSLSFSISTHACTKRARMGTICDMTVATFPPSRPLLLFFPLHPDSNSGSRWPSCSLSPLFRHTQSVFTLLPRFLSSSFPSLCMHMIIILLILLLNHPLSLPCPSLPPPPSRHERAKPRPDRCSQLKQDLPVVAPHKRVLVKGNCRVQVMDVVIILIYQGHRQINAIVRREQATDHGRAPIHIFCPRGLVGVVRRVIKRVGQARVSYHSGKPHKDPELVSAPFGKEEGHAQEDDERDEHGLGGLVEGAGGDVTEVSPIIMQGLCAPEKGLNPLRAMSG